jgi:predicted transglutaminase-like cysteine proteinase
MCATAGAGQPDTDLSSAAPDRDAAPAPTQGPGPSLQPSVADQPFAFSATDGPAAYAQKWRAVAAAVETELDILGRCRSEPEGCSPAVMDFFAIIDAAQARQGRARLGEVNRAVNLAIRYRSDAARHGASDAWASPLATLAAGEGDCEDYAIVKYAALREAGVPPGDLRLVVVRDARLGQNHAVLAARLEDRWLVLDNRRFLLLEDREVRNYQPIAAFGADGGPFRLAADGREGQPDAAAQATTVASGADPS